MGGRPKKQDYEPSEAEKASAAVARAEKLFFNENYAPKLREMRDTARNFNFRDSVRGRANADVMQALTGQASFRGASDVSRMGDTSQAISGQLQKADEAATDVRNTMSTGVLGTARGQAAEAQTGMAQASRLATSDALTRARANQQTAMAKFDAGAGMALAAGMRGYDAYKGTDKFAEVQGPPTRDGQAPVRRRDFRERAREAGSNLFGNFFGLGGD